jgi:hypothetical protein
MSLSREFATACLRRPFKHGGEFVHVVEPIKARHELPNARDGGPVEGGGGAATEFFLELFVAQRLVGILRANGARLSDVTASALIFPSRISGRAGPGATKLIVI